METATATAPARRRRIFPGWYVVGGAMVIHFSVSVAFVYGFQAFFNPITQHFGWPRTVTAGAFSLQRLEGGFVSPIAGLLVDRVGTRSMAVAGVLLIGGGLVVLSQIQEAWHYYLGFIVISLGMSATFASFPAAVVHWFVRMRGRALGVMSSGPIPSGLFVPLVVLLIEVVGWRNALLLLGLAFVAIGLPAATFIRHHPQTYGYRPDGDPVEDDPGTTGQLQAAASTPGPQDRTRHGAASGLSIRQAVTSPAFWLLALIFGVHQMGPGALFVVQIPYFESIGFSSQAAASTLGVFTVLSGIGRLGAGYLMDKWDRKKIVAGLMASNAVGLLVLVNITDYWMVFPFALFFGIAFGGMIPGRSILISEYFGIRNFASVQGIINSVDVVFGIATPFIVGLSFDLAGSYQPAFLGIAILIALSTPLPLLLRKPRALAEPGAS